MSAGALDWLAQSGIATNKLLTVTEDMWQAGGLGTWNTAPLPEPLPAVLQVYHISGSVPYVTVGFAGLTGAITGRVFICPVSDAAGGHERRRGALAVRRGFSSRRNSARGRQ
jgi:hypothetical protein